MGEEQQLSKSQPIWHVAVLFVFTMSAYTIVWFYKNWRDLAASAADMPAHNISAETSKYFGGGSPVLRALGTAVPLLQLYLTTTFFVRAAALNSADTFARKRPWLAGVGLAAVMLACFCLAKLPSYWRLLYLLAVIPLMVAQQWLNIYWHKTEPAGTIVRQAFSAGELVALILGAVLLGLNVTQAMIE
jgi:hypothetical protein